MAKVKNWHLDRFAVAYLDDAKNEHWLQTEFNKSAAQYACKVLNEHEINNGRLAKFYVIEI